MEEQFTGNSNEVLQEILRQMRRMGDRISSLEIKRSTPVRPSTPDNNRYEEDVEDNLCYKQRARRRRRDFKLLYTFFEQDD